MSMVQMGRVWKIETRADYDTAMDTLDGNEFIANMSDDSYNYRREMEEIAKQRAMVTRMAREKGII